MLREKTPSLSYFSLGYDSVVSSDFSSNLISNSSKQFLEINTRAEFWGGCSKWGDLSPTSETL